jgi:hypothetical protein
MTWTIHLLCAAVAASTTALAIVGEARVSIWHVAIMLAAQYVLFLLFAWAVLALRRREPTP